MEQFIVPEQRFFFFKYVVIPKRFSQGLLLCDHVIR